MADSKGAMQVDTALIRQLAELLDETQLTEIEVQDGLADIETPTTIKVKLGHQGGIATAN